MNPPTLGGRASASAKAATFAQAQAQLEAAQREIRHLKEQRDILKKRWASSPNPTQRYERIYAMKSCHSVLMLCRLFEVSLSGYYDWQKRQLQPGKRAREDQLLAQEIKTIHAQSRKTYGSPRITNQLRKNGLKHGRNRIARLMKKHYLCGRQKRRYRVCTTDSNHDHPIAPNRLAQAPKASKANQIWVADITYIPTQEGWFYLAAILDLYSRKIVGWNMSPHLDTQLILKALQMALLIRQPPAHLLFHSDRGVQYASNDYRQALADAGLIPSMSRKGNCYDNAVMESFWSTLKLELVYRCNFITRQQARSALFDYIESFYNPQRSHSALNYFSPVDFESLNN
jgi:putative transposase